MLKVWFSAMLMFVSCSAFSYERLSFYKLILSPQNYEEKTIYLTGYFVQDGSKCLVISHSKETALMYREYEMVILCKEYLNETASLNVFEKLTNRYGSVAGTFSIKKCVSSLKLGNSLNYLGCLSSIDVLYGPVYEEGPMMPPPPFK